jgi:hypothetical protein
MTAPPATPVASAPRCGSCGYDTTGLTTLTCPECGADLRAAGITRGGPAYPFAKFAGSVLALLVAWVLSGAVLFGAVRDLTPHRQHVRQMTGLMGARSGAYRGVNVIATGSGWADEHPRMRVELYLSPLDANATPPLPLAASHRLTADDVLKWLASAGIDTTDSGVREEAQALALTATRAQRVRGRLGTGFGWGGSSYSSTVRTSGNATPFASATHTVTGSTTPSNLHAVVFGVLWVALLAAGVAYLLRIMTPLHRRSPST